VRRFPALVAALVALLVPLPAARATDPTVLVATRNDGALVRLTLTGRLASATVLVPGGPYTYHVAMQARRTSVSYVSTTDLHDSDRNDVSVLDATTGTHRQVTHDGRSGFLLQSPDGSVRYVLRTPAGGGSFTSLVRIDARGRVRTLLPPLHGDAMYSGASISPDGRVIYVARGTEGSSSLLAVNTATGRATSCCRPTPWRRRSPATARP
jgi:DNA-binding beta-propeller fold protein YncE